jgi:hypothetical protein
MTNVGSGVPARRSPTDHSDAARREREGPRLAGEDQSCFTSVTIFVSDCFASPKSMNVFGS